MERARYNCNKLYLLIIAIIINENYHKDISKLAAWKESRRWPTGWRQRIFSIKISDAYHPGHWTDISAVHSLDNIDPITQQVMTVLCPPRGACTPNWPIGDQRGELCVPKCLEVVKHCPDLFTGKLKLEVAWCLFFVRVNNQQNCPFTKS